MYVFLSFCLGLIYVIAVESRFRARRAVREPHMYFIARLLSPLDICLFARGEKRILGFQI